MKEFALKHQTTGKYCRLVRNAMLSGVFTCVLVAGQDVRPSLAHAAPANSANTDLTHTKHRRNHLPDHEHVAHADVLHSRNLKPSLAHGAPANAANTDLAHRKHGRNHSSDYKHVANADVLHSHHLKKQYGDETTPHSGTLSQLFGGIASV
jgi:hypothetical protein